MPLMIKCYECKIAKLQDIAVRATPFIVTNSDYTFTKTKVDFYSNLRYYQGF